MLELKPQALWRYFEAISAIPRGSGNEKAAGDFVLKWAADRGFQSEQDAVGSVLVRVPATPGHEKAETVVLQGPLDIVCEKHSHVTHDFLKDPIVPMVEGEYVTANGTTLGADNGIGIAAALWVCDNKVCSHGPLELLFTVDEETGLKGANNLQPGFLKGKLLLNLDTEEDAAIYIGCAGGQDTTISLRVTRTKATPGTKAYHVKISGLKGGHSGGDIHEGRGNANRLLGRVLQDWEARSITYQLVSVEGGIKRNAIPREASAVVLMDEKALHEAKAALNSTSSTFAEELAGIEEGIKATVAPCHHELPPLSEKSKGRVVALMVAMPHGVLGMSRDVPGLVETSTNFAILETKRGKIDFVTSQRSSVLSQREWAVRQVAALGSLAGGEATHSAGYPGWKPEPNSELLKKAVETYRGLFGSDPEVKAIHAGLECGLIGEKFPSMSMISIGPTIENPHSPSERLHIPAVEKFAKLLTALLEKLA